VGGDGHCAVAAGAGAATSAGLGWGSFRLGGSTAKVTSAAAQSTAAETVNPVV
jgi:hypothetical protein